MGIGIVLVLVALVCVAVHGFTLGWTVWLIVAAICLVVALIAGALPLAGYDWPARGPRGPA